MRPPVFLSRRPAEPPDADLAGWYRRLLRAVAGHQVPGRHLAAAGGRWLADNQSCRNLVAWSWDGNPDRDQHVVVVNLSGQPAQGRIPLEWADLTGRNWRLADLLGDAVFERAGDELAVPGLFVALEPWQFHLLALQRSATASAG